MHQDIDPACHDTGWCRAPASAWCVTNCVYCGSKLVERNGRWFTHDWHLWPNPQPQAGYINENGYTESGPRSDGPSLC